MEDPSSSAATGSPRARQGDHDGADTSEDVDRGVLCDEVCDEEELCSKAATDFLSLRSTSGDPFQDGEEPLDDAVYDRNGEFLLFKKPDEWTRGDALANLVFELRADDELFGGTERLLCVRDLFESGKEGAVKDQEAADARSVDAEPSDEPHVTAVTPTFISGALVSTVPSLENPTPSAPRRRFPCTLEGCDRVFERGRQLRVHLLSHAACRPFKCSVDGCDWAFATEYKLKRHLDTHEGKKDFMCDVVGCGQHFTTVYNLRAHMKLHGRPTFGCLSPGCSQVFGTRRKMELHLREHQELDAPYRCPEAGCGKAYYSSNTLASHLRVHQHRPEELCCPFPECGRAFGRACKLRLHLRQHTGERPYACPACAWTFASASKLTRHMRKHTGDRRYVCPEPGCGKAFMRPEHLRGHSVVHSGGRPFPCTHPADGSSQEGEDDDEETAMAAVSSPSQPSSPDLAPRLVQENQSGSARTDFASHHHRRSSHRNNLLPGAVDVVLTSSAAVLLQQDENPGDLYSELSVLAEHTATSDIGATIRLQDLD
ncbi:zinc finger protein ZXDC-like isoform X4 [Dermacentor albipictus]|uniref:zinc finger protein ZXDC-like isoform X4 n=1 Tax=Dermacentor albipictus TaxID=60249 RepID=UPI0031FDA244